MEENSSKEIPVAEIPPLEENMVVENEPVSATDENTATLAEYKKEMMQNGLQDSDVDYLLSEYQNLENVKGVKMHCTSCDKHIGSAPNDLEDRYEHPLLKVLICAKCFQFYTSGEFEKDEDGSELYCRWCGEGGQVFCCSKCPFVFCKKCITRNLGKSMAKIIGSSDNWICFSCDPSSISRYRASYWAVQKYSIIMIQKSEENGNKETLFIDGNTCCFGVKRRAHSTLEQILRKKPKTDNSLLYQQVLDSTKNKKVKKKYEPKRPTWHSLISEQPEDEVICTPDILPLEPLDDSPPHSPITIEPAPPLYKVVPHNIPSNNPMQLPVLQQIPPLRPLRPPKISVTELQNQVQKKYTQIVLTPTRPRFSSNNQPILLQKNQPILPKSGPPSNGTYKYVLKSKPKTFVPNVVNTNYVMAATASKTDSQASVATTSKLSTISKSSDNDWFEKAVLEYADMTEFISARISSLSEMHKNASSDRSVAELYKSFQSYMDIALGKIGKIKRTMISNYEKEMANRMREKIVNPFAIKCVKRDRKENSDNDIYSTSEDSRDSLTTNKTRLITANNLKPEEVLFDMDVTNASDEENTSSKNSTRTTPAPEQVDDSDSDDDVQEVEYTRNNEIIQIVDSDEEIIEKEDVDESPTVPVSILRNIKDKFNIDNMTIQELVKYLSAVIIASKVHKDTNEARNQTISEKDRRDIVKKIISRIESLSEEQFANATTVNNDDTISTVNNNNIEECEKTEIEMNIEDKSIGISEQLESVDNNKLGETEDTPDSKKDTNNDKSIENDDTEQSTTQSSINISADLKELGDIEEILDSNVVLRSNNSATSFVDEFSKFVTNKSDEPAEDNIDDSPDALKETLIIARELDIIPEYVDDICNNRDNGSLSLPPDSITGISPGDLSLLAKEENVNNENEVLKKDNDSDIILNSEILALQQLAENCVSSVDVHKSSAECKG